MTITESLWARHQRRPLLAPGLVLTVAVGVAGFVGAVDPNQPGHYPTCPFLMLTGQFCPGCGSLRTIHALAHGDLPAALGLNVLTVAMIGLLAWMWGRWAWRSWRGTPRMKVAHPALLWGLFSVILVFWLVRNLPFGQALAP